jgi:gas vesicle protein
LNPLRNKVDLKEVTMSNRDEFGAFAIGVLVGSLAAGVAALLFAPQSGEETRELIKEKSIELRDQAQLTAEEAMARAEAFAADARARGDEFARRVINGTRQSEEVAVPSMAAETPAGKPTAV